MDSQSVESTGYNVRFGKSQYFTAFETGLSKFAIFSETVLTYTGPLFIDLPEYTVIILAPLASSERLFLRAKSIILFDSLTSENDEVIVEYSASCVNFGADIRSSKDELIVGPTDLKNHRLSLSAKKKIVGHFKRGVQNTDGVAILEALGMISEQEKKSKSF